MNLLKSLGKYQIIAILSIIILVTTSLWAWEKYEHELENAQHTESYEKIQEENQLLKYEIKNLQEQNQLLHKVLELKQNLK